MMKVAILGATGMVGQRFVALLEKHPQLRISVVCASSRSAGRPYKHAVDWKLSSKLPESVGNLVVQPCDASFEEMQSVSIVFSALDSSVAGPIELEFAKRGFAVFSNARNHRMDPDVAIVLPLVNPDHLRISIEEQQTQSRNWNGFIVTNSNCSTTGLATALRPLQLAWGSIEEVHVVTMQAISGAGYPGVSSIDILDNVVPYISGEEPKLECESLKILGDFNDHAFQLLDRPKISAQCHRVAVSDGHLAAVSVRPPRHVVEAALSSEDIVAQAIKAFQSYESPCTDLNLPSAPPKPIVLLEANDRPQPRLDRNQGNGYSVTVGRLRVCPIFGLKFTVLVHNTILGAAGGSILNAELALAQNVVKLSVGKALEKSFDDARQSVV